ncbi:MAG TPA: serine/threonine-protein kinase [Myxococcaceae bacterium]
MDPSALPAGTEVGRWRVVRQCGQGAFGAVYRVEQVGDPAAESRALKLALLPRDPRFTREAELLSRIHSPHVPRLHDKGTWLLAGNTALPYVVIDWVEGASLYEWAFHQQRTSREVLRVLAQVARALAATHAAGGVHRDVKGDNVLVRLEDASAVLLDFGAGTFRGARPLTTEPLPPGTREYRSPEAVRFLWQWSPLSATRYEAGPADDVYALGVTAYYLVTRQYPPAVNASEDRTHLVPAERVPPEALVTVCPELSALICRMLSDEPSARGSAAELARALEDATKEAGAEADWPILPRKARVPPRRMGARSRGGPASVRRHWRAAALVAGALFIGGGGIMLGHQWERATAMAQWAWAEGKRRVGLADEEDAAVASAEPPRTERRGFSIDMPRKPFNEQRRPPCTAPAEEVHGGCWVRLNGVVPPCGDQAYEWKNRCYWPILVPPRLPTSAPPE